MMINIIKDLMINNNINLFYRNDSISISIDETTSWVQLEKIVSVLGSKLGYSISLERLKGVESKFDRDDQFLQQKVRDH